mmetsp:Transcript_115037/g.199569  ORF Transcript_115037/g.199569 Transcript_115037/m.199569 type:complete len:310 (-) Transcript_115037:71-1000(-)
MHRSTMVAQSAACIFLAVLAAIIPRAQASTSLRGSQGEGSAEQTVTPSASSIAETLKALDTNGDGKVGRQEIEGFAKSQGLSAEEVRADFADLDRNGDGELEASELGASPVESEPSTEPALSAVRTTGHRANAPRAVKSERMHVATKPAHVAPRLEASTSLLEPLPEQAQESLEVIPQKGSNKELSVKSMQIDAEHQAGSVLAESFARQAGQLFQQGMQDEQQALYFDNLAKELRSNVSSTLRSANRDTRRAAHEAVAHVAERAIAEVHRLNSESERTEHAARLRASRANEALQRVLKLQSAMLPRAGS